VIADSVFVGKTILQNETINFESTCFSAGKKLSFLWCECVCVCLFPFQMFSYVIRIHETGYEFYDLGSVPRVIIVFSYDQ